jgi:hypothetical protein
MTHLYCQVLLYTNDHFDFYLGPSKEETNHRTLCQRALWDLSKGKRKITALCAKGPFRTCPREKRENQYMVTESPYIVITTHGNTSKLLN